MAYFVHVIPQRLYNELLDKKVLQESEHYPKTHISLTQKLLSKIPTTLRNEAGNLIKELIKDKVIIISGENIICSRTSKEISEDSLVKILQAVILEDGSAQNIKEWKCLETYFNFPKRQKLNESTSIVPNQNKKVDCNWITFESRFKFLQQ